eukprot:TRINITY_DN7109_c0_g1_i1.p1 TRINITY_DN7109_c0_g1~~TRINITY_DN7109_c0_g1_i1.p1  ORF type:complete len:140 (-),score=34.16 TRINITY_DN7109_c0_g1_i1:460-879(-)
MASTCALDPALDPIWNKFRLSNSPLACMILKCDKETFSVVLDEKLDSTTFEDITDRLPESAPRYLLISYKLTHDDGRVSYPLIMIYYNPENVNSAVRMMYASSKTQIVNKYNLMKSFDLVDSEDLTEEWLVHQLKTGKR